MTTSETRRYDMLLRVQEFGKTHQQHFPASSPGGQAFEALSAVVTRLGEEAVSKRSTMREGRHRKKAARAALLEYLDTMSRCARVVARDVPGFDDKYKLGRLRSDQSILTAGKTFAREAIASGTHFITYGMRETFLDELNALIEDADQAVRAWQAARDGHASARANIEAALDEAFAIVRRLDIFVANQLGSDAGATAVWERDRRYDSVRRTRRARETPVTSAAEPGVTPVPPVPPVTPVPLPVSLPLPVPEAVAVPAVPAVPTTPSPEREVA